MIPNVGVGILSKVSSFNAGILVTVSSVSMLCGIRGVVLLTNSMISAIYDVGADINFVVYISI